MKHTAIEKQNTFGFIYNTLTACSTSPHRCPQEAIISTHMWSKSECTFTHRKSMSYDVDYFHAGCWFPGRCSHFFNNFSFLNKGAGVFFLRMKRDNDCRFILSPFRHVRTDHLHCFLLFLRKTKTPMAAANPSTIDATIPTAMGTAENCASQYGVFLSH